MSMRGTSNFLVVGWFVTLGPTSNIKAILVTDELPCVASSFFLSEYSHTHMTERTHPETHRLHTHTYVYVHRHSQQQGGLECFPPRP